jgi:YVTN family beta-propeller protein
MTVGTTPTGIAVNTITNKIHVSNDASSKASVIDGSTNIVTSVAIGARPSAAAVNPVTNKIYAPNLNGGTVSVIDGSTDTVSATLAMVAFSARKRSGSTR